MKEVCIDTAMQERRAYCFGNGHGMVRRRTVGNTGHAVRWPSILLL